MAYAPFGINITCGLWGRLVAFKEESSKQTLLPDEWYLHTQNSEPLPAAAGSII